MSQSENIWEGDYLNRQTEVEYLTKYFNSLYSSRKKGRGFVLAINADWGSGKTFMMQRWYRQLVREDCLAVYFDAWANDFAMDPLIAFIAELDKAMKSHFASIPTVRTKAYEAWVIAKSALIPTLKVFSIAAAKHGLGISIDKISELYERKEFSLFGDDSTAEEGGGNDEREHVFDVKEIGDKLSKVVEGILKKQESTKAAIELFKKKLEQLIGCLGGGERQLPILVLVDELDRCRPDYAIELLEGIKHLFGVPGVYFVVATNIPQLAHSVRAIYGNGFDGERYLKRFFDMEYSLPMPDAKKFTANLLSKMDLKNTGEFVTGYEKIFPEMRADEYLAFTFEVYSATFSLTLRDQQQVVNLLDAIFLTLNGSIKKIHIHFLMFLIIVYHKSRQIFNVITHGKTLGDMESIDMIYPRNAPELFKCRANASMGLTSFYATSIASQYFKLIGPPRRSEENTDEFPGCLIKEVCGHDKEIVVLKAYPEMVRRAGQFRI